MKIEDQVCSLELAKQLKKLGFKQDSFFSFSNDGSLCISSAGIDDTFISAYTVAELGEMLPQNMVKGEEYPLVITKLKKEWLVEYLDCGEDGGHYWNKGWMAEMSEFTQADALAKMLIYLKTNNLL